MVVKYYKKIRYSLANSDEPWIMLKICDNVLTMFRIALITWLGFRQLPSLV
jgi:hypothetical protein